MSAYPKLCAPRILSPAHARVQASELVRAQSEKWGNCKRRKRKMETKTESGNGKRKRKAEKGNGRHSNTYTVQAINARIGA